MITILMIPFENQDGFKEQCETIEATIGAEYEILCAILDVDRTAAWFQEYCYDKGIRHLMLPNLGISNLLNILAARAQGDYLYYISDVMTLSREDIGWGDVATKMVYRKDGISGGILAPFPTFPNCVGIFMPIRTFHVFGYYSCPIFESPLFGYRWNASILTELNRLVNIPSKITYAPIPDFGVLRGDSDIFNATRAARLNVVERARGFTEKAYDTDTADN
jgi:glycosyltransferase involved in cell wall biosynthesis